MRIKAYLMESSIIEKLESFSDVSDEDPKFFSEVGQLIDSLDSEDVSDDTTKVIDELIQKIIDVLLTLGDEEFDDDTNKQFMDVVKIMGLDESDEMDEGLQVKSRKTKAGRKKSEKSKLRGSDKIKYLKNLKKNRKKYKKSALVRQQTKKKSKKYRKTAGAKKVQKKYKTLNKK